MIKKLLKPTLDCDFTNFLFIVIKRFILDKEIESLAFENKIRRELTNKTLSTILEIRDEAIVKASVTENHGSEHIANGALYAEKGDDK